MKFIKLTSPDGPILINLEKIDVISACDPKRGNHDTIVNTKIFMTGDKEWYNILETTEEIAKILPN